MMSKNPFTEALGDRLHDLPDAIREHFGMGEGTRCFRGTMTRIWRRPGLRGILAIPALRLASAMNMLFAETGKNVGFSLDHRVEEEASGGPIMVWSRRFHFPHVTRRFDAIMQYNAERGCIVDWLGSNGRLEVELHPAIVDRGIEIQSGKQWVRLGGGRLLLPGWIAGQATIREWQDEEQNQRIRVTVSNPLLGDFFGYEVSFAPVAAKESLEAPAMSVPEPGVVIPTARWFLLALIAILGTVCVAASFAWTGSDLLERWGAAVGAGAGAGWIGFGIALLKTAPAVAAVTWIDMCLETMALGMAILSAIFFANLAQRWGASSASIPLMIHAGIVAISDVTMATYFTRRAQQAGISLLHGLGLWIFVLNGICAAVVALWLLT